MFDFLENPIQADDLGIPLFQETPIWHFWAAFIAARTDHCTDHREFRFENDVLLQGVMAFVMAFG